MQRIKKTVGVTLQGNFSLLYAYAVIDGTTYTSAATVRGETVSVYVGGSSNVSGASPKVTLDGVTVQRGAGTYVYTGEKDIIVTFSTSVVFGAPVMGWCDITTV